MGARTTALTALIACRKQGAWSDAVLKDYIKRDRLDRRDAALASRLCYGVQQNRQLLDYYLAQFVRGGLKKQQPVVLDILRIGAYQILFLDRIPASAAVNEAVNMAKKQAGPKVGGFVNGVLRSLLREKDHLTPPEDLATRYSHPAEVVELLR
jgi:16S rRNA (cytosine967-C5)-methyltransferase